MGVDDELATAISGLNATEPPSTASNSRTLLDETIRANHRARDITRDFTEACKELKTGQLVKDETFSLWDALQALEIMDPKMDSGCLVQGETLDETFDLGASLLPVEIIAIMDQLLSFEMAWQRGFALFQTVFTSKHIYHIITQSRSPIEMPFFPPSSRDTEEELQPLVHLVLRAFCIGLVLHCDMCIEVITAQQYYEEEDVNTQTYNKDMLQKVNENDVLQLLDEAMLWLEQSKISERERDALLLRLHLRKASITVFLPRSQAVPWEKIKIAIERIQSTHHLAKPVPTAFDPKMYRRLSIMAPTRPSADIPFATACSDTARMYDDMEAASVLRDLHELHPEPSVLRNYLWAFAARQPRPLPVARARLQMDLFVDLPRAAPVSANMMLEELLALGLPDDSLLLGEVGGELAPSDPKFIALSSLENWMQRAEPIFQNVLRSLCQNRARIRRCLVNILPEIKGLVEPDTAPDMPTPDLPSYISSLTATTAQLHALQVSQWIAQLGFEQDIYLPFELSLQYTHLAALATAHHSILTSLHTSLTTTAASSHPVFPPPQIPSARATLSTKLSSSTKRLDASATLSDLATAFATIYTLLSRTSALQTPPAPYAPRTLQDELRARPFGPDAPTWTAALATRNANAHRSATDLLTDADAALARATKTIPTLVGAAAAEMLGAAGSEGAHDAAWKDVLRSAITMRLKVVRVLGEAVRSVDGRAEKLEGRVKCRVPRAEEGAHLWWIVPEVTVEAGGV